MGVSCDRLKLGSTAALDCRTGQNKGRYCKKGALIPTHLVGPIQYFENKNKFQNNRGNFEIDLENPNLAILVTLYSITIQIYFKLWSLLGKNHPNFAYLK